MRTLNADAQAWLDAAVADGWTVEYGPWHTTPTDDDRSVVCKRDDLLVWLVDRECGMPGTEKKHEQWRSAWARHGRHIVTVPDTYDPEWARTASGQCTECKQTGNPERLKPLSFAGRVCPTCDTKELRAEKEPPGWTN